MKIVIIGGGVAGLAFGSIMQNKGHQVVINEKGDSIPLGGNAFMMHQEGRDVLKDLLHDNQSVPGSEINHFNMMGADGSVLLRSDMNSWRCMKRSDLIEVLIGTINNNSIKYNRGFSHFVYDRGQAVAAVFENGEAETGDLFVGSDGCHSVVRQLLFGETRFTATEVKEVLGTLKNPGLVKQLKNTFTKYQHTEKGISFGCIPVSSDEVVWFSQYDVRLEKTTPQTKEDTRSLSLELLSGFPDFVTNVVKETDLANIYLWNTKDFDVLPAFHKGNIVLVGDAAHVALPFTSAGTTNALIDARCLADQIDKHESLSASMIAFYNERVESVKEHVKLGRDLKRKFLNPLLLTGETPDIPLISIAVVHPEKEKKNKLEIIYFTDPICSTCWTIQPQLRMLKLSYSDSLSLKYVMGGLLPSWENFNRGGITQPSDVPAHWLDVSGESGMPIDGSVWNESPLHSSYPPAIAFKAAQMQNIDRSLLFLRRLNELVFMEGKNIAREEVIRMAALQTGLDIKKLMKDIRHNAYAAFMEDIAYTRRKKIDHLPSFLFRVNGIDTELMKGDFSYEKFESTMLKYAPHIAKGPPIRSPMDVFRDYPSVTHHEFKFLTQTDDHEASRMLNEMMRFGQVIRQKTRAGSVFLSTAKNGAFFI